jgi:hypothetical protein
MLSWVLSLLRIERVGELWAAITGVESINPSAFLPVRTASINETRFCFLLRLSLISRMAEDCLDLVVVVDDMTVTNDNEQLAGGMRTTWYLVL